MAAAPRVNPTIIPFGGAIGLAMPDYVVPTVSGMILNRAVSGVSGLTGWTQLYSGAPLPYWLDPGDMLPAPLGSGTAYVYQVIDPNGTTQTAPIIPAAGISSFSDQFGPLFIRLLQAAVNSVTLPPGIKPVQITTQMPVGGWQALPFVVVNLDLVQQEDTGVGQDVPNPGQDNVWPYSLFAKRVYRVTVLSASAGERDFYRDYLLATFQVLRSYVFVPLGLTMRQTFQAASGTDAKEWEGKIPGFYYADLLLDIEGVYDVLITSNYGLIETITTAMTLPSGSVTTTQNPQTP